MYQTHASQVDQKDYVQYSESESAHAISRVVDEFHVTLPDTSARVLSREGVAVLLHCDDTGKYNEVHCTLTPTHICTRIHTFTSKFLRILTHEESMESRCA